MTTAQEREAEIAEALAFVMQQMRQPKTLRVEQKSKTERQSDTRTSKVGSSSGSGPKEIDEDGFRTYIRSNTISNIATVDEAFEQGGEVRFETTRINLAEHEVPSSRQVKRMSSQKKVPTNRVFGANSGTGVGSSRSVVLGIIKAIAHPETGCIVVERSYYNRLPEHMKATTLPNSGTTGMTR